MAITIHKITYDKGKRIAVCYDLNGEAERWIFARQGKEWELFVLKYRQELDAFDAKSAKKEPPVAQIPNVKKKKLKRTVKIVAPIILLPLLALGALWMMRTDFRSLVPTYGSRHISLHPSVFCMAIGLALLLPLYLPISKLKTWSKPKLVLFIILLTIFVVAAIFATLFLMIFLYKSS